MKRSSELALSYCGASDEKFHRNILNYTLSTKQRLMIWNHQVMRLSKRFDSSEIFWKLKSFRSTSPQLRFLSSCLDAETSGSRENNKMTKLIKTCVISSLILISVVKSNADLVDCEFSGFERAVELYKICSIKKTAITYYGVVISSSVDNTVGTVDVSNNKKLKFLPASPATQFPRLQTYEASSCSIKAVTKSNFANLKNLRFLYLGFNDITTIYRETFDDLSSLVELVLRKINLI